MGIIKYIFPQTSQSTMEMDLLNADPTQEENLHKLKRLVQTPNSFFMDVICINVVKSQLYSLTLRPLSTANTAAPCFAHQLEAAPSSSSAAPGEERVTESDLQ